MVVNTAGFVPVFDFGAPKILTAMAREAVSGGQFLFASGADNVVSSGANSFVSADLLIATAASGANFLGVAMHNAGSNSTVAVLVEGVVISTAYGAVTAGRPVVTDGGHSVANLTRAGSQPAVILGSGDETPCGRALTAAASGGYCLLWVNA